uniref:Putative photoprotein-like protein n=1 Tax=Ocyropsis maculata TaxID=140483 RepID=A0A0A0RX24_9METZ|nr:putative photoprotein-like protein [Ocyropsis maculata]
MGICQSNNRRPLIKDVYWKLSMIDFFSIEDRNGDGFITLEEIIANTAPLEEHCSASTEKMKALAQGLTEFWTEAGIKPGKKVSKKNFLKGLSKLGEKELERESKGIPTLHSAVANALFDIIDENDNNQLSEKEIRNWMAASGLNPEDAVQIMRDADYREKGYITREELIESEFCSFFRPDKCMIQLGIRVV